MNDQPKPNTDRHLWPQVSEEANPDSIHVTASGGIGINCGGLVIVKPLREWHRLAVTSTREVPVRLQEALHEASVYGIGATSDTNQRVILETAKAFAASPAQAQPSKNPENDAGSPLADLVTRFSAALLEKLKAAEKKYVWNDRWMRDDWRADCQRQLHEHQAKGDPRDVAIYCAFMWHHGWPTVDHAEIASLTQREPFDPAADDRWNEGCDFALTQLCSFLSVDHKSVSWDAATETVEGDVGAVIGSILGKKFGEDWMPDGAVPAEGTIDCSCARAGFPGSCDNCDAKSGPIKYWRDRALEAEGKKPKTVGADYIIKTINHLREEEGDSVTILCDNPDGPPDVAIECNGAWTDWQDRRFVGADLIEALSAAYLQCIQLRAAVDYGKKWSKDAPRPSPAASVIERIAAANLSDPATDDLTVPLAIELAEEKAKHALTLQELERRSQPETVEFTDVERAAVEYLSAAGFEVVERENEWIAHVDEAEISVTALACAIYSGRRK